MQKYLFILLLLIFSCDEPVIDGCTTATACNYNADATKDDGSCLENDCADVCVGTSVVDECDICGGDGKDAITSCCPNGVSPNNEIADCAGICGGSAEEDNCGICNGDGSGCLPYRAVDFLIVFIGLLSFILHPYIMLSCTTRMLR